MINGRVSRYVISLCICLVTVVSLLLYQCSTRVQRERYNHITVYHHERIAPNVRRPNETKLTEAWQALALFEWDIDHLGINGFNCPNAIDVGEFGNWKVCMSEPYTIQPPCLVYSFGIWNDFSFDDAMGNLGCEVHSFDPSLVNLTDHRRSQNVFFHKLGLAEINSDVFIPRRDVYVRSEQRWKVRTLRSIKEMLGHKGRVLDVLKVDIESYEWNVLENLLEENILDNVRQFLFEWHIFWDKPKMNEYPKLYSLYERLLERGFKSFHKYQCCRGNMDYKVFNSQATTLLVNTRFKGG